MTDRPTTEPEPPDPRLDRTEAEDEVAPTERPSAAEGEVDESGGSRPPPPSQAEGEREDAG